MMNWFKCSEVPPPKDRLILMTTGIAWYREDKQKSSGVSKRLKHSGLVELVYWYHEEEVLKNKTIVHEYWVKFGGGGWWLDGSFNYWAEFENPITIGDITSREDTSPFNLSTTVPSVDDLIPIEYTTEEQHQIQLSKALFG